MTSPSDPAPVVPQHMRAIARATEVRSQRAEMKRQLGNDRDPFRLMKGNDPAWEDIAAITKLRHVLLAVPGIGDVTADEIMEASGIGADSKIRLGQLSYEGRAQVAVLVAQALGRERELEVRDATVD